MAYLPVSLLTILVIISTTPFVLSYESTTGTLNQPLGDFTIPSWIKNTAGWWASDIIDDNSFVTGIQWMISNNVIVLPPTEQGEGDGENIIPNWIKNTAGWWADDQIHDITFVSAIKYLVGEGIIIIKQQDIVEEEYMETEQVKEFDMLVNDGSCKECVNWGYVGSEYFIKIETFEEYRGNTLDGVTINAKIISRDGGLMHDFGLLTTEDGIYTNQIIIPNMDWFGDNILSVTGEYNGIEKTIEKEFAVFSSHGSKPSSTGCQGTNPFSVADKDGTTTGMRFSSDGNRMYVLGNDNDTVYQYTLPKKYCLDHAGFNRSFSVTAKETLPQDVAFNSAGTKMFIVGETGKDITEYTLSKSWDIATATYADECDLTADSSGITKPRAVDFNSAGTKMRVLSSNTDDIHEYNLTTPYDVSTCAFVGASEDFSVTAKDGNPRGMAFKSDGTKMFFVGGTNDKIHEYTLSTAYDVSTATYVDAFSISNEETGPGELEFSSDGKSMFIIGQAGDEINQYYLTTAWDISTAYHR